MTIRTRYNIGDTLTVNGVDYEIISMHIYESEHTHTERYYLGHELWITLEGEKS